MFICSINFIPLGTFVLLKDTKARTSPWYLFGGVKGKTELTSQADGKNGKSQTCCLSLNMSSKRDMLVRTGTQGDSRRYLRFLKPPNGVVLFGALNQPQKQLPRTQKQLNTPQTSTLKKGYLKHTINKNSNILKKQKNNRVTEKAKNHQTKKQNKLPHK